MAERDLGTNWQELQGLRVEVYRNLHRAPGTLSIRAAEGPMRGRVVGHARFVELASCTFHVSARGRERVRELRRKEVHAVIRGVLLSASNEVPDSREACLVAFGEPAVQAWYDPYQVDTFVDKATRLPLFSAARTAAYGALLLVAGLPAR